MLTQHVILTRKQCLLIFRYKYYGVPSVPKLVVIMLFINDVVHLYMGRLIYK